MNLFVVYSPSIFSNAENVASNEMVILERIMKLKLVFRKKRPWLNFKVLSQH